MGHGLSGEADSSSAGQDILHILFNPKVHYRSHKGLPLVPSVRQINLQEPCVLYIGRAHRYPPNTPFYIFLKQIYILNLLNMLNTLSFLLFKMSFIS
jgi:hypothetical protein